MKKFVVLIWALAFLAGLSLPAPAQVQGGAPNVTNATGTLPASHGGTGITSLGTGVATLLGTPSSANLRAALTDESGTGAAVFAGGNIGAATATSLSFGGTALSVFTESSWTPTMSGSGGGSATYTAQSGLATKIGKTVIAIGNITVNVNSILGNVRIDSLPYTSSTSGATGSCAISLYTGFTFTGYTQLIAFVNANTTRAPLQTVGTGIANAALPTAGMANGAIIYFVCTYQTD